MIGIEPTKQSRLEERVTVRLALEIIAFVMLSVLFLRSIGVF